MAQCQFLVKRKNRLCKLRAREGCSYCGEHLTELGAAVEDEGRRRIPCPFDSDHSVFLKDLEKHREVCNAKPGPVPVYFSENLNVIGDIYGVEEQNNMSDEGKDEAGGDSPLFRGMSPEDFRSLVKKIRAVRDQLPSSYQNDFTPLDESERVSHTMKEKLQKEALSSRIASSIAFSCNKTAVVEMGCGKGGLSHNLITAYPEAVRGCRFYLVDRDGFKGKFDKRAEESGAEVTITRAKIDIKDLDLDKLIDDSVEHVVVISKHLCGAATCLSLVALQKLLEARPGIRIDIRIALCCHHRCTQQTFVGQSILHQPFNLTSHEFAQLCGLSSWAICGWRYGTGEERSADDFLQKQLHFSGFTYEECTRIGWECKQAINEFRLAFIRDSLGLPATIWPYISKNITLENLILETQ